MPVIVREVHAGNDGISCIPVQVLRYSFFRATAHVRLVSFPHPMSVREVHAGHGDTWLRALQSYTFRVSSAVNEINSRSASHLLSFKYVSDG
jgi:hypothetical protein